MFWTYLAYIIAFFFAMNIGASGTAASMGSAYGADAIKNKWLAMVLVAIAAFLGAVLGGGEVVKTIGSGIIPSKILTIELVVLILAGATLTLFIANLMGIPLSTSEVTVGAIVGAGIAFKSLFINSLLVIIAFWVIVPVVSFIITFIFGKLIAKSEKRWPSLTKQGKWKKWLGRILVLGGCFEAFSAGMNNVANAVGPLVGAGMLSTSKGIWIGGLFVALGAILLGGRVIETNGKKITKLSLLEGSAVSFTGGALVTIASIFGLPIPLTQVTTCGILGIGASQKGIGFWQKAVIRKILKVWLISPLASLVISYTLINLLIKTNFYNIIVILSTLIAALGTLSLYANIRKEKSTIHDEGGGI
ncbi:anion permease [Bacillus sp. AFS076308]|uniref:inorganic phosphate transporter n=1 Tax=unclassified Bacillus (in: firmicutes) TaxID=185979 RepID=UPI000BF92C7F|nr:MULTISPECIES: inorganic phosphate transporter [unclassified Bacillus (in: firmicutes)]PFN98146.1 anion permease [Bacillus sp. AFS076308]PGV50861.1 anion permease [Bacillus sp. AFS037270]